MILGALHSSKFAERWSQSATGAVPVVVRYWRDYEAEHSVAESIPSCRDEHYRVVTLEELECANGYVIRVDFAGLRGARETCAFAYLGTLECHAGQLREIGVLLAGYNVGIVRLEADSGSYRLVPSRLCSGDGQ